MLLSILQVWVLCKIFLLGSINFQFLFFYYESIVFGVPIEVIVQRQESSRVIPHILVRCADYLVLSGTEFQSYIPTSMRLYMHVIFCMLWKFDFICLCLFSFVGLNSPCLFKSDGDKKVLQQLVSMYNQGKGSSLYD